MYGKNNLLTSEVIVSSIGKTRRTAAILTFALTALSLAYPFDASADVDPDGAREYETPGVSRTAPNAPQAGDPRLTTQYRNQAPRPTNVVDNGEYVPADGVIDGSNVKQFLNSGSTIDATAMEEASIKADNFTQMPDHPGKPGKYKKKKGLIGAISRGWTKTCNALGFPVGDDDVGVDASLSSDLPDSVRQAYGAYNPNKQ